jgi:hypothetical protein
MAAFTGTMLRTFTANWDDFQRKRLMEETLIAWELANEVRIFMVEFLLDFTVDYLSGFTSSTLVTI